MLSDIDSIVEFSSQLSSPESLASIDSEQLEQLVKQHTTFDRILVSVAKPPSDLDVPSPSPMPPKDQDIAQLFGHLTIVNRPSVRHDMVSSSFAIDTAALAKVKETVSLVGQLDFDCVPPASPAAKEISKIYVVGGRREGCITCNIGTLARPQFSTFSLYWRGEVITVGGNSSGTWHNDVLAYNVNNQQERVVASKLLTNGDIIGACCYDSQESVYFLTLRDQDFYRFSLITRRIELLNKIPVKAPQGSSLLFASDKGRLKVFFVGQDNFCSYDVSDDKWSVIPLEQSDSGYPQPFVLFNGIVGV
eukprot:gene9771-11410_t